MPQGTISWDGGSGQGVTLSPLGHSPPAVQSLKLQHRASELPQAAGHQGLRLSSSTPAPEAGETKGDTPWGGIIGIPFHTGPVGACAKVSESPDVFLIIYYNFSSWESILDVRIQTSTGKSDLW